MKNVLNRSQHSSQGKENRPLPNNPINMGLGSMIRLKNQIGHDLFRKVAKIIETDSQPNILMAAMEFGSIYINNEPITAKVGGLAVVINDMINNFPKFLNKRGKGKISFTFMAYDGVPKTDYVKSFQIRMGFRTETVEVYKTSHEMGATLYFVDHPLFKRRSIRNKDRNLYIPAPGENYSGREEWEEAFTMGLFNKSIAKIQEHIGANIYHAHDYHTGLAATLMDKEVAVSLTIHNAGPGYQGIYWTKNFGGTRVSHPDYNFGVPTGDFEANDYLLDLLGIDYDTYMQHFEENGTFNSLKVLNQIATNNLVSGIPVSQGYAEELTLSPCQIINKIEKEKGWGPKNSKEIYIPNAGLNLGLLKGIENGLGDRAHAKNHQFLAKKSESEIAHIHPLITDLNDRREWLKGLNFGDDLLSPFGIDRTHKMKAKLKSMLQRNAGLEVTPHRPLFVLISRLVDQKNVDVLAENIAHIVAHGGQVVIGGQPGDKVGLDVASKIHLIEHNPAHKNQVRFYNEFINKEMAALIQAAGDFFVITSKFEPCGLTDIEAAWMGTIPLCRKTGGLGKVKNGIYYQWQDSSDREGEILSLRHKLDHALDLFHNKHNEFKTMRIKGMQEDFSWDIALSKYFEGYRTSSLYKLIKQIDKLVCEGMNPYIAKDILQEVFRFMPMDLVESMQVTLQDKKDATQFESIVANYDFYREIRVQKREKAPLKQALRRNHELVS